MQAITLHFQPEDNSRQRRRYDTAVFTVFRASQSREISGEFQELQGRKCSLQLL